VTTPCRVGAPAQDRDRGAAIAERNASEPAWAAAVRSTADRLEGELQRTSLEVSPADYEVASQAISEARELLSRPGLEVPDGGWRGAGCWAGRPRPGGPAPTRTRPGPRCTPRGLALLAIEPPEVVKARLADLAATVVTTLSPGDLRIPGYLRTLELLAPARAEITTADRAQLRAIREACDNAARRRPLRRPAATATRW